MKHSLPLFNFALSITKQKKTLLSLFVIAIISQFLFPASIFSQPVINFSPSSIDFSQRRTGSMSGFDFTISNTGTSNLSISSISTGTQRFRLDTVNITFPILIGTGVSKSLRVWFTPITAASYSDTLTVISNASNTPTAKVLLTGQGVNVTPVLGDIYWKATVPDNPFTTADDFQPISIRQISDMNGDSKNDIIVATGNYFIHCYNGNSSGTADLMWSFNTGYNNNNTGAVTWEEGMQIRDDVNGDGIQDVVFGCAGGNEMVYTVSGRTGKQIWAWGDSVSFQDGDIEAVRADKDFNGDGVKDVLVSASGTGTGTGGRHALVCLDGLTGNQIFFVTQPSDFTGDIISTQYGGAIGNGSNAGTYSVKGFNNSGGQIWSYTTTGKIWTMKEFPTINADTVKEIIGNFGFTGSLFCITANSGTVNWTKTLGSSNNGRIQLLDDLDSNGYIDFTLYGPQVAYRLDSKTGNIIWQNALASSYLRGADFLTDLNGDGIREVLISTQQPGKVLILNGANGNILFTHTWGTSLTQRGDRCAALQSIDGNSTSEFIGGCRDGRIFCFSGGQNLPIGISPSSTNVPDKFLLEQNFPNPFNPTTNINYSIPFDSKVLIKIFDMTGKEIKEIVNELQKAGSYSINFNASEFASGTYFYKITALNSRNNFTSTKKMILVK
ncbi:MAG: PQQ-binding-like beta-propeller repeat protein [Ignavibacteria bacterium]|nr:PQQ-binding-like beta-propeller repeat protein [Ignavibacteria bacterium]